MRTVEKMVSARLRVFVEKSFSSNEDRRCAWVVVWMAMTEALAHLGTFAASISKDTAREALVVQFGEERAKALEHAFDTGDTSAVERLIGEGWEAHGGSN